MEEKLQNMVSDLLHIDEGTTNKLLDLYANNGVDTYFLSNDNVDNIGTYTLNVVKNHIGKIANTALRKSAKIVEKEQFISNATNLNYFDWKCSDGTADSQKLDKFITDAYSNK